MKSFPCLRTFSCLKSALYGPSFRGILWRVYLFLAFRVNQFWIQLSYVIFVSLVGFLVLKITNPKNVLDEPKDFDVFFMSVSATTVSSMGTVEMEVFSNAQLVVLTLLMLVGGEVFTSMLGLQLMKNKLKRGDGIQNRVDSGSMELPTKTSSDAFDDQIEGGMTIGPQFEFEESGLSHFTGSEDFRRSCIRYLGFVVLGFHIITHLIGSLVIFLYLSTVSSAREVVENKRIKLATFSVFATVSTFTNCGFIPTNENMVVFKRNSGLLLLFIPLLLSGNTLFPPCLRLLIWVLRKFMKRGRLEFDYMLKNPTEMGYDYLFPNLHCMLLCLTVLGFILLQLLIFCAMEWHSEALHGLNSYQKIVGAFFQSANSRHAGESIVDISVLSPAILVLYLVMMYLPPHTTFLPTRGDERIKENRENNHRRRDSLQDPIFSQLSYLATFIILICITERRKMSEDPINFNVLNIAVEVVSAYGNVGFSTGYSCKRQLKPDGHCTDKWYGFSGRWSNEGKLILIIVMFFGRLKKFSMNGGKAWKLE